MFSKQKLPLAYEQRTVYEICYNMGKAKTLYTKHHLASGNILFDERLEHEKTKNFTMMTDTFGNKHFEDDEFSKLVKFYDQVSSISTQVPYKIYL